MYGTDWYMISKEHHPETYLDDFWSAFSTDATLRPWARAFFGRNALRFLRLAEVADRADMPFTPVQRKYWRQLIADVERP
jgi:hypothetical protein